MSGKRKSSKITGVKNAKGFNAALAAKCLLVGVLGSIVLVIFFALLEQAWAGQIIINKGLRNAFFFQLACVIALIPVFIGALAAWSVSSQKFHFNGNAIAGLIAGLTSGPGFTVALSVLIAMLGVSGKGLADWKAIHDMAFPSLTTGLIGYQSDIPLLVMFTVLSMMLSTIGGGIFFVLSYYARKGALRKVALSENAGSRILLYIAALLVAITIIPPVVVFAGTQTGLVAHQEFVFPVTVQRVGDDAIMFTNNGGEDLNSFDQSSPPIVYISTGGSFVKNMTDQQAATKDSLNVTLDPASGLGWAKDSTLKVTGPSIVDLSFTDNATGKKMVHVMVAGMSTDGQELVLLEKSV